VIPSEIDDLPVTAIGKRALQGKRLTSVSIPDSVIVIGVGAFQHNQLPSVNIGNSVVAIGAYAFQENQLASVNIPDGVAKIGGWAFQYNRLARITIPANVKIAEDAFYGNVAEVYAHEGSQAGTYVSGDNGKAWSNR
jgi:hypothetical protein